MGSRIDVDVEAIGGKFGLHAGIPFLIGGVFAFEVAPFVDGLGEFVGVGVVFLDRVILVVHGLFEGSPVTGSGLRLDGVDPFGELRDGEYDREDTADDE